MNQGPAREDKVDLVKLLTKLRPYWYIFVIATLIGLTGAYLFNTTKTRVYQIKSSILIQEENTIKPVMLNMNMHGNQSTVNNSIAVLESYSLIDTVVSDMEAGVSYFEKARLFEPFPRTEIYLNAPFRVNFDKDHSQPYYEEFTLNIIDEDWFSLAGIKGLEGLTEEKQYFFGQKIEGRGFSFIINRVKPYSEEIHSKRTYQFVIMNPAELATIYRGSLLIEPLYPESSVFDISFQASNRQRGLDFADRLTYEFIRRNLNEKNHAAQNTIRFIESQIALTAGELNASESRLQNFREKEQLMDISVMATQLVNELQILDKERSVEEVKISYYNFLQEYVSDKRDFSEVFGPSALGIDDPMLNNLLVELSNLHSERGRLLLNTTERSPSVQAIDQNIRQAKATLEENIRNIRAASGILMADLNNRISRLERRISQLPGTERELVGLQRMFNITDATYNFLLEKQAEAGIALASNMADHKIIDSARYIGTTSPKTTLNYALGLVLGIFLPLLFLSLRDMLNTRILSKEQITAALNFPIIGVVPSYKSQLKNGEIEVVIFDQPYSPVTESFRNIRSNLHFFSPKKQDNIIVVTSTRSGEGKTFTAVNLAAVLALSKKRTLYIDADIRKVQTNHFTKDMLEFGLSNYLIGRAGLEEVINVSSWSDHMFIMNSGIVSPNPAELIESEAMTRLLKEELQEFEYIIVDTSPVGMVADAKALMKQADLNLFIIRHNFSQNTDLDYIQDFSSKAEIKNLVIAINDIKQSNKSYGHGYGFGYGGEYGKINGKKKKSFIKSSFADSL
ncbi:MAG: GumC family protein [Bacteroidales bacterium]